MAEAMLPRRSHELMESMTAEDFETASIRSAAPSYCSEAPSSHYTVPHSGGSLLPPYSAPASGSAERAASSGPGRHQSVPGLAAARPNAAPGRRAAAASATSSSGAGNAAPVFANPLLQPHADNVRRNELPNMSQFRIPSWSTISSNPNARLYHSVALRRVAAAEHASAAAEIGGLMRRLAVLERMEQEEAAASRRRAAAAAGANGGAGANGNENERAGAGASNSGSGRGSAGNGNVFRPLEDPYLVGETAARRARAERLARENHASGDDALLREDRRWDWFLGQMKGRQGSGWNQAKSRLQRASKVSPVILKHIRARRM